MVQTKGKVKNATLEAVVIKADGSKIDLGVVADTNRKKGFIKFLKKGAK